MKLVLQRAGGTRETGNLVEAGAHYSPTAARVAETLFSTYFTVARTRNHPAAGYQSTRRQPAPARQSPCNHRLSPPLASLSSPHRTIACSPVPSRPCPTFPKSSPPPLLPPPRSPSAVCHTKTPEGCAPHGRYRTACTVRVPYCAGTRTRTRTRPSPASRLSEARPSPLPACVPPRAVATRRAAGLASHARVPSPLGLTDAQLAACAVPR